MVEPPLERLNRQEEVRVVARLEPPGFDVGRLRAAEPIRELPSLADAECHERSGELGPLLGRPIVPGLSRRARDSLGSREDRALLRDALLQMVPGHIQVLAERIGDLSTKPLGDGAAGSGRNSRSPQ